MGFLTDLIIFLIKIMQFETGFENFTNNDNMDVEIVWLNKSLEKSAFCLKTHPENRQFA